jgi:uncharacterized protein
VTNSIFEQIASEIIARPEQVAAAATLLAEGATVPFISRYRKEVTGGLDDTQLRTLETRLVYLRELEERRATIIKSVEEQGKLTDQLRAELLVADTKTRLEDLYLPYKPKRRTKAQIAKEAGLEPLADVLFTDKGCNPELLAAQYLNPEKEITEIKQALDGARAILIERFSEDANLLKKLREVMSNKGEVVSKVAEGKEGEGAKYTDYFNFREGISKIPSHRALALFRGQSEGILSIELTLPESMTQGGTHPCKHIIAEHFGISGGSTPAGKWLMEAVRWAWETKLAYSMEIDLFVELRAKAETEAIRVFAMNLKDLLLAAPAGMRPTIGLDPGIRTGVKVAVINATGKVVENTVIYPHEPKNDWDNSITILAALCARHGVELVSIGNGTASRETDKLVADLMKKFPVLKVTKVTVSEAGASVYSASEIAAKEFPDLDVTIRGAVSIARRLQDPLAELVKIDPKAIGVGQYQHDVDQSALARSLDAVVEDCVNGVGVDLNTASVALLSRVSGLSSTLAENIVTYRDTHGAFSSRRALFNVPRFGEKTFEQAAGFLRIANGDTPLDASAVHPEAYPVVERLLTKLGKNLKEVIGNAALLKTVRPSELVDDKFGEPTIRDILKELEKPGRDPRPEFKTAQFNEAVSEIQHLRSGMLLEGTVTNVTNFGAFVDIGVHQDGLVHISALSDKFIKDPREVVKAGDIVKVRVVEVDAPRKRIALTMKLAEAIKSTQAGAGTGKAALSKPAPRQKSRAEPEVAFNSLGNALAAAMTQMKKNA